LLLEVNAPLAEERGKFGGLAMPGFARWTEEVAWRNATHVLPVTAVLGETIQKAGVAPSRILVTSNGVDTEAFRLVEPGARPQLPEAFKLGPVLGFVGYVRAWHGLPQVVDLEAQARRLGVDGRVQVCGVIGRDGLAGYISTFDIALQPEVTAYASPLKLFEYMALGRAIIAPDAPNIREILTHEVDALLFEPDNPASLAAAIRRLVGDGALRARLGAAAADKIHQEDISWARNARCAISLVKSAGRH
jgi:glycosyltransferase involved in cell wall biosynthesis